MSFSCLLAHPQSDLPTAFATFSAKISNLTAEGVNEKGLAAHLLYFGTMQQPDRNPKRKGVNGLVWVRYVLGKG